MRKKISDDRRTTIGGGEESENRVQYIILYIHRRASIYIVVVHDTRCPGADHLFIYFFVRTCRFFFSLYFFFFSYIILVCTNIGIIISRVRVFFLNNFFHLTTFAVCSPSAHAPISSAREQIRLHARGEDASVQWAGVRLSARPQRLNNNFIIIITFTISNYRFSRPPRRRRVDNVDSTTVICNTDARDTGRGGGAVEIYYYYTADRARV